MKSLLSLPLIPHDRIVAIRKVKGVKVYDARLIAIMSIDAVEGILTFNTADFERFRNVRVIHPSTL